MISFTFFPVSFKEPVHPSDVQIIWLSLQSACVELQVLARCRTKSLIGVSIEELKAVLWRTPGVTSGGHHVMLWREVLRADAMNLNQSEATKV